MCVTPYKKQFGCIYHGFRKPEFAVLDMLAPPGASHEKMAIFGPKLAKTPTKMMAYSVKQTVLTNYGVIFAQKIVKTTVEVELGG